MKCLECGHEIMYNSDEKIFICQGCGEINE